MASKLVAAALLALSIVVCFASEESEHVLKLTVANYDSKVKDGKLYFVKYFAPWCGHCKRLAPIWDELARDVKDQGVSVAHVDCVTDREICDREGIQSLPTLNVWSNGVKKEKYSGGRDLASLKDYILSEAKSFKAEL